MPPGGVPDRGLPYRSWPERSIPLAPGVSPASLDLDVFYTDFVELGARYGDEGEGEVGYTDYVELTVRVKT